MQVEVSNAPAHSRHAGQTYHFCSDRCRERFEAAAGRFDERVPEPVRS